MSQFDIATTDAVMKVKFMVSVLRIRLHEFFCDFDGLRCGYITPTQFKSGLSMSGIARFIDQKQLAHLTEEFIDPNDKQKRVKYAAFCEEIETVFTRKNLEKSLHNYDENDSVVNGTLGVYTNRYATHRVDCIVPPRKPERYEWFSPAAADDER